MTFNRIKTVIYWIIIVVLYYNTFLYWWCGGGRERVIKTVIRVDGQHGPFKGGKRRVTYET
jgi:hypothetical protein